MYVCQRLTKPEASESFKFPNSRLLAKWHPVLSCKIVCLCLVQGNISKVLLIKCKTIVTLNDVKELTLSCHVNIKGCYGYSC